MFVYALFLNGNRTDGKKYELIINKYLVKKKKTMILVDVVTVFTLFRTEDRRYTILNCTYLQLFTARVVTSRVFRRHQLIHVCVQYSLLRRWFFQRKIMKYISKLWIILK